VSRDRLIQPLIVERLINPASVHGRRVIARWVWRAFLLVVLIWVVRFVLIPQFADARAALMSLRHVSTSLLVFAVVLELASIACYSALSRVTLNRTTRPNYLTILRIDVATEGVNNTVPGGGPTATAVKFRLLTLAGASAANAITGTTVEIATSVLTLGGLLGAAIALSAASMNGNPEYIVAAVVVAGVAGLSGAALLLLTRHRAATIAFVGRWAHRVPWVSEDAAVAFLGTVADHLHEYHAKPGRLAVAVGWAAANWLLDAGALWVFLVAFGFTIDPLRLVVAYGLACLVGLLPITPGGLGIIEGVLVPAIVGFGTPHGVAVLAVLTWRLVQFWIPIPLAGVAYASLKAGPLRRIHSEPGLRIEPSHTGARPRAADDAD
jgi:uncharacterized protein (TIRG00374 family)